MRTMRSTRVGTARLRAAWGSWADGWTLGTVALALVAVVPIVAVLGVALNPADDIWEHLASTVLPLYITNTLQLGAGVGIGSISIGVGAAWLVTMCRFPGRRIFERALVLPLAMPAYVIAYVYTDILEYAGPVQGALREIFEWTTKREYWFPEIRSLGGAISMMTLVLYPYVYLLSRAAFMEQSVSLLEASHVLGRGPWRGFLTVALPVARPAIVIGVSLVLMETLNDFGTVDFFAVSTLTLGIFDVWMNMNNMAGAAQLASLLLFFVIALVLLERFARRRRRFYPTTTKYTALPGYRLVGGRGALAAVACALPVLFGFVLPSGVLATYAVVYFGDAFNDAILVHAINSIMLSSLAAALAVGVAIFMAYGVRMHGGVGLTVFTRLASMGYAARRRACRRRDGGVVLLGQQYRRLYARGPGDIDWVAVQRHHRRGLVRVSCALSGALVWNPGSQPRKDHSEHGRRCAKPRPWARRDVASRPSAAHES